MRPFRFRFTIRSMMIWVVIAAIFLTIGVALQHTVDVFFLMERGPGKFGPVAHIVLLIVLTGVVALPFAVAVILGLGPASKNRVQHRLIARRLTAALALVIGLTVLHYPVDGLRLAQQLKDGNYVAFYQQYRIWPGERFTPCLEMISPSGKARSYPIARNTKYNAIPEVRTNVDQTVIWFVDNPGLSKAYRYGGVWCSLNRVTGEFVGAEGPYPAGVSETSGFPLFWPCSSPQLPFQYRVGVSDIHL
jgi:hypothetical protein